MHYHQFWQAVSPHECGNENVFDAFNRNKDTTIRRPVDSVIDYIQTRNELFGNIGSEFLQLNTLVLLT